MTCFCSCLFLLLKYVFLCAFCVCVCKSELKKKYQKNSCYFCLLGARIVATVLFFFSFISCFSNLSLAAFLARVCVCVCVYCVGSFGVEFRLCVRLCLFDASFGLFWNDTSHFEKNDLFCVISFAFYVCN